MFRYIFVIPRFWIYGENPDMKLWRDAGVARDNDRSSIRSGDQNQFELQCI